MKRLVFSFLAAIAATGFAGCRSNDYFKDGHDERQERLEDRRDRRAMEREKRDGGMDFFERSEEWWEKNQRKMERNEWGDF